MQQVTTIHRTPLRRLALRFCVWLVSLMYDTNDGDELIGAMNHIMRNWAVQHGQNIVGQCVFTVTMISAPGDPVQTRTAMARSGYVTPDGWAGIWDDAARSLPLRGISVKGR